MVKCYEKSYGRYFINSADEWRELDKLRKIEIDSQKEIRKLIKEQKDKNRKQKDKEELIQRIDFHNNLKEKELPKRFFENKSSDYIRSDFVRPNNDKSNYSVSTINSYNNNDTKIIKDNSLLKNNKIPLEENININNKPETIIIPDIDIDYDNNNKIIKDNNNIIKKKSKYIIVPDEDDILNNSGKRRIEESNLNINKNSKKKNR
jgi:hypothetical protein